MVSGSSLVWPAESCCPVSSLSSAVPLIARVETEPLGFRIEMLIHTTPKLHFILMCRTAHTAARQDFFYNSPMHTSSTKNTSKRLENLSLPPTRTVPNVSKDADQALYAISDNQRPASAKWEHEDRAEFREWILE